MTTLKNFIESKLTVQKNLVIGKEFYIKDEKVLLLGMQTFIDDSFYCDDQEDFKPATFMYLLYQNEMEDDDEYEDYDYTEVTNRDSLLQEINLAGKKTNWVTEVERFIVSGKEFRTYGMTNGPLSDHYLSGHIIKLAAEQKIIADEWLNQDMENLWLAEYEINSDIYNMDWLDESLVIDTNFEEEDIPKYLGHVISCGLNEKKNQVIEFNNEIIGDIMIKIIGLEEVNVSDNNALLLEYEAPEFIVPQFYSTEYLNDTLESNCSAICAFNINKNRSDSRFAFIKYTDCDENDNIEIELFSYTIIQCD